MERFLQIQPFLAAAACEDVELNRYEPNVTTEILFTIESSGSIAFTDPEAQRALAVQEVISEYNSNPGGVEFRIIRFSGSSIGPTDGFTMDPAELDGAVMQLREADRVTNYRGAIGRATNLVSGDIPGSDLGERVRSRYVTIYLSDGLLLPWPEPELPDAKVLEWG